MMAMVPNSTDASSKEAGRAECGAALDKVIPPLPEVVEVVEVVELLPGAI
jgi:hypothetical protein